MGIKPPGTIAAMIRLYVVVVQIDGYGFAAKVPLRHRVRLRTPFVTRVVVEDSKIIIIRTDGLSPIRGVHGARHYKYGKMNKLPL